MKKGIVFLGLISLMISAVNAQQDKTSLSLQVSGAAAANRAQLASYVWTRTVQVFVEGELKNTIVSSLSVGPDGKMVTTAVSSTPTSAAPTKGIRGKIAKDKIGDMKSYIDEAMTVSMGYLYMSKGKMVDFFNAAGISKTGNTLVVNGSNLNKPNDQLTLILNSSTLAYISQTFKSTVSNGDALAGTVNYKTYDNGLTAMNNSELDLPAKKMKLRVSNSNYAKKLQ
jgi:hypothetical protein